MNNLLQIAISPCPNDTFAFYSLIHSGRYTVDFLDIEELNRALIERKYPVAKGSFAIMKKIATKYEILPVGSAIGSGVGPVLVGKIHPHAKIALPGEHTTAHKLFHFWQQSQPDLKTAALLQMPFYEMLPALKKGKVDAAVLIHEGRFVYAAQGLDLVVDLGAYWESQTGSMVPLGCIYADKSLPAEAKADFAANLRESLNFSLREHSAGSLIYKERILPFMQQMAQEKDPQVVEAHVKTYVTTDTTELSLAAHNSISVFSERCLDYLQPKTGNFI